MLKIGCVVEIIRGMFCKLIKMKEKPNAVLQKEIMYFLMHNSKTMELISNL